MFFYIVCQAPIKSFTASVRSCVCHIKVMHIETSFYHVFLLCVSSPYQIIYSECAFKCVCHIKVIYIKTSLSSHILLCVSSPKIWCFFTLRVKSLSNHLQRVCVYVGDTSKSLTSKSLLSKSSTSRRLFTSEESSRPSHENTTNSISVSRLYQVVINECLNVSYQSHRHRDDSS